MNKRAGKLQGYRPVRHEGNHRWGVLLRGECTRVFDEMGRKAT